MPPFPTPLPPLRHPPRRAAAYGRPLAALALAALAALAALLADRAAAQAPSTSSAAVADPPVVELASVAADHDGDLLPDRLGGRVRVRGVLVSPPGASRQNGVDMAALADGSGGTLLVDPSGMLAGLQRGDEVDVVGRVESFHGLEQLQVERATRLGRRPVPAPMDVAPAAIAGEALSGRVVRVRGRLETRPDEGVRRGFFVASEGERVQLYVPEPIASAPDFGLTMADDGRSVEVVALAGQFDREPPFRDGYQLILLAPGDVRASGVARPELRRWVVAGVVVALLVLLLVHRVSACQLQRQSATDPMTGLRNRRGLQRAMTEALAAVRAGGAPLAVVLLDLDDFKAANDRYGHQVGDEVLRAVARVLCERVRPLGGTACRYGGDEFVLLLPGAEQARAGEVADAVVAALRVVTVPAADGELRLTLGASAGVAVARGGEETTADALLREADAALYQGKRGGKGQVRLALRAV